MSCEGVRDTTEASTMLPVFRVGFAQSRLELNILSNGLSESLNKPFKLLNFCNTSRCRHLTSPDIIG